jgi:hypothetical protein
MNNNGDPCLDEVAMSRAVGLERARRILERFSSVDTTSDIHIDVNVPDSNPCYIASAVRTNVSPKASTTRRNADEGEIARPLAEQLTPVPLPDPKNDLRDIIARELAPETVPFSRPSEEITQTLHKRVVATAWESALSSVDLESEVARRSIRTLAELFAADEANKVWHSLWEEHCSSYFDLHQADVLLQRYVPARSGTRLFLLQSYCRLLLVEILRKIGHDMHGKFKPGFFDWLELVPQQALEAPRADISNNFALGDVAAYSTVEDVSNFLSYMYQEIFSPELRHLTGEYYTPSWLIDHSLSSVESIAKQSGLPRRILDPAAGSGGFLAHYIGRAVRRGQLDAFQVIAADVNPLAVEFCEANLAIAKSMMRGFVDKIESTVLLADTICDPVEELPSAPLFGSERGLSKTILGENFKQNQDWSSGAWSICHAHRMSEQATRTFAASLSRYLSDSFRVSNTLSASVIIGNPPWMTWDALRSSYRERMASQWSSSSLVTQKGWRAKVAAGKTDLSTLFVYRAAERHAAQNAVMSFVLPLSLFQSRHAGAGFRRFRCGGGRHYRLISLDDFSETRVFGDAANRTAVALFEVDKTPHYPAKFIKWTNGQSRPDLIGTTQLCRPIDRDDPSSPIVAFGKHEVSSLNGIGKSQYRARGGVNTGGANTILWIGVAEKSGDLARIQNVGASRKTKSSVCSGWVESQVVHPLLIGTDVSRWLARPSKHILMLYSADRPKKAIEESVACTEYPRAYAFASNFRRELLARKEYHRWGGTGPFYEVYRIGPYTFSPIKVVWQHTGFRDRLRVAVLDDRGRSVTIPDQKVILIPSSNIDEAHYICAFLSSSFVSLTLQRYLGVDASTHILDYIGLKAYSDDNSHHRRLVQLSIAAHRAAASRADVSEYERSIDSVVAAMLS